ncbi:MAG: FkbM family methyltransferase [Ginsengibacter sp.]
MNIRHIKFLRRKSIFGKLLRLPIRLIPDNTVLKIFSGLLKGKKFIKGSHNISIAIGTYERKQSERFASYCAASNCFWDLGAHVGYYTLLYNSQNPEGKTFAFEPSEANAKLYHRHMELNQIKNYQLFQAAVSNKEGILSFNKTRSTVAGKLDETGDTKVKAMQLSKFIEKNEFAVPGLVKMDIEGGEENALLDVKEIFMKTKPVLFLSTHGKQVHLNCIRLLTEMGYNLEPLDKPNLNDCREILAS